VQGIVVEVGSLFDVLDMVVCSVGNGVEVVGGGNVD
jgi:hypothetical protein